MNNYRTVKIPEDLVNTIKNIMHKHKELGYRSHSEFVIDAIRRRVENLLLKSDNEKDSNSKIQIL
jgi:metal-responsive CopG/Arc/MetJ family transcriptional regulator